jgi:hypothetical protein
VFQEIIDLTSDDIARQKQAAKLLVIGFAEHWLEAWPDFPSAIEEVKGSLQENRISRVAINGEAVDWKRVYSLPWPLLRSWLSLRLAVRQATQENRGKRTAWVEGGGDWQISASSAKIVSGFSLETNGYRLDFRASPEGSLPPRPDRRGRPGGAPEFQGQRSSPSIALTCFRHTPTS